MRVAKLQKHILNITILLLLVSCNTSASLSNGLVAHYKLDGTSGIVVDETGNYSGTNNGALRGETGKLDKAFDFDGVDDYVDTGYGNGVIFNEITISAWVYTEDTDDASGIVCSRKYSNENDSNYGALNIGHGNQIPDFTIKDIGSAQSSDGMIIKYQWVMLTGTYDGSTLKIYINGQLKGTGAGTGSWIPTANFEIGRDNMRLYETGRWYDGKIDDVRIWDRALSTSEIVELYNIPEPATVLLLGLGGIALRKRKKLMSK